MSRDTHDQHAKTKRAIEWLGCSSLAAVIAEGAPGQTMCWCRESKHDQDRRTN